METKARMDLLMRSILALGFWILVMLAAVAQAQPRRPSSDHEVLETVLEPRRGLVLKRLRDLLSTSSANIDLAAQLAQAHLTLATRTGDPRHLGYAQAALAPWWRQSKPPLRIALLRSSLHQKRHDFQAALRDLEYVLATDPTNAQAWFSQAVVWQVLGDYPAAEQSCRHLEGLVSKTTTTVCQEAVQSFSGHATSSYNRLIELLGAADGRMTPELRLWVLTALAEIAVRIDRVDAAERHFRAALALDEHDLYVLSAYADFLLDQGQPRAVKTLLEGAGTSDGVLLRLALAEQALNADTNRYASILAQRFVSYRWREDKAHFREQARFALQVEKDPAQALSHALENWRRQREPWDARLVLLSALAAHDHSSAEPTLRWIKKSGIEDVRLNRLATQLAAQR